MLAWMSTRPRTTVRHYTETEPPRVLEGCRLTDVRSDLPSDAGGGIRQTGKHAAKLADVLRAQMEIDPLLLGRGPPLDPSGCSASTIPATRPVYR